MNNILNSQNGVTVIFLVFSKEFNTIYIQVSLKQNFIKCHPEPCLSLCPPVSLLHAILHLEIMIGKKCNK